MTDSRTVVFRDAVEYQIQDRPDHAAYFVLGVRKSGSSVLNSIVEALSRFNGLNFVDVAGKMFEHGIPVSEWQEDENLSDILAPGNVYGGFRNSPKAFYRSELYRDSRKIFLVRDPRDALVSEYFSNAYSHSIPEAGAERESMLRLRDSTQAASIEQYVIRMARPLKAVLRDYRRLEDDPNCIRFRYEDVIFEKGKLIDDICAFFGWEIHENQRSAILGWADVRPQQERPTEFIRRVTPGDHSEKLSSRTITRLNRIFSGELARYGYS